MLLSSFHEKVGAVDGSFELPRYVELQTVIPLIAVILPLTIMLLVVIMLPSTYNLLVEETLELPIATFPVASSKNKNILLLLETKDVADILY